MKTFLRWIFVCTGTLWFAMATSMLEAAEIKADLPFGQEVVISEGVTIKLNRIIPAGPDTLGGSAYTEYNFTLKNDSDLEFVILKIAAMVYNYGHSFMIRNLDEIALQEDPNNPRTEDRAKWREELEKQGFFGMADGISVMPHKSATNSIWVKQSRDEMATRVHLYLFDSKNRRSGNLVKLDLHPDTLPRDATR